MLKINVFAALLFTTILGFSTQAWSQCTLSPANPSIQTVCQGTAITTLTFTSTGGNGAIFSGLPAGVTGSFNNGSISISGTPTVAGTFKYFVDLIGCAGGATAAASGFLVVIPFNTLTFVSSSSTTNQTLCAGSFMDSVRIRVTGATGFSATGLPNGVTALLRNDTIIIGGIPLNGAAGLPWANDTLLTYLISLTGGCTGGTNSISGSLRVRNNSAIALQSGGNDAQTVCLSSPINNITYTTGRANRVIFFGLPTGVSGSFDSLNRRATISGTPTVLGTFAYSVLTNGGCTGSPNLATGTITVQGNSVAVQPGSAPVNQTVCLGGTIQDIRYATTGATVQGTSTTYGLPPGLQANWLANVLTISGTVSSTAIPGTYNFSVPINGLSGCPSVNATGSIIVTNYSTAGQASYSPTLCLGDSIGSSALLPNITHSTTIATGIGSPMGLPIGCTAVFNVVTRTITITGRPSGIGVFIYTIPLLGCGSANATGMITVQGYTIEVQPSSAPTTQTVCLGGAIQNIRYATTGATGIGPATGLPSGLTAAWVGNVLTISGTVDTSVTPGTFNFSVPLSGSPNCAVVNATGSIVVTANRTVGAASDTPTLCIGSALPSNITHVTTIATGIDTPTGLPPGCTAVFSGNATTGMVTISGTPTTIGVYNYIIPLLGCGTANASGTITVQGYTIEVQPSSAPTTQTVCLGGVIQNIRYATTGATGLDTTSNNNYGLPTGLMANWSANVLTISGTVDTSVTSGTFNFSVPLSGSPNCAVVNATGSIVVTANRTVGAASDTPTLCIGSALPSNITHVTTIATGIDTPTGLPPGCTAVFSGNATTGMVTISGTPTTIGVYNYTIPLLGCGTANATGKITVQGYTIEVQPSSAPTNQTVCLGGAIQNIRYATTGATGIDTTSNNNYGLPTGLMANWSANVLTISGTVDTSVTPGTFNFSVPLRGLPNCSVVNATGSIVVIGNRTVGAASDTPTLCIGSALPSNITHVTTIATGIDTPNGLPPGCTAVFSGNATTGMVTISGTPIAVGVYNYTIPLLGCGTANASGTITVQGYTIEVQPSSAPTTQTVCLGGAIQNIRYATTGATGIDTTSNNNYGLPTGLMANWSANVLTISGTVDTSVTPGTFNFSVPLSGSPNCAVVNATGSIVVPGNRTVGPASSTPTFCLGLALPSNITHATTLVRGIGIPTGLPPGCTAVFSGNTTTGIVTISGIPTVIGVFNYTVPLLSPLSGCGTANATGTITVQGSRVVLQPSSAPTTQTVCLGGAIQNIRYATTGATGIDTTSNNNYGLPTGLMANWSANVLTISGTVSTTATPGTYNFSVPMSGLSCPSVNATGSIVVLGYNSISLTSGNHTPTLCLGDSIGFNVPSIVYTNNGLPNGVLVTGLPSGVRHEYNSINKTTTIRGIPRVRGVFVYRITALGGCTQSSSNSVTGVITVKGTTIRLDKKDPNLSTPDVVTNVQTRCTGRPIQPIVFYTTSATGANLRPSLDASYGLTENFDSITGIFTISGIPRRQFTYSGVVVMLGNCTTSQIMPAINITVLDSNRINLTSAIGTKNQIIFRNTTISPITYSTVGATDARFRGLPSGVTGTWAANTVTISGTPLSIGTYRYIIDLVGGCPVGRLNSDTGTITVTTGGSLIGGGNDSQGDDGNLSNPAILYNPGHSQNVRLVTNRGPMSILSVYPIPGSDFLFVRGLAELEKVKLVVIDQTGRVIHEINADSGDFLKGEFKLNLSPLADGVYFLQVKDLIGGFEQVLRFSVKH